MASENLADHDAKMDNLCSEYPPNAFVRVVRGTRGKKTFIMLYTDEQLTDLKTLCCTGQTVLGVSKARNLCDMNVTITCYKQCNVNRQTTGKPPIFLGPILIHHDSDLKTYVRFFGELRFELIGCDMTKLVIGSSDDKTLIEAIKTSFRQSTHILCRLQRKKATETVQEKDLYPDWTNNNCRSVINGLKQMIDREPKPIPDLIEALRRRVNSECNDLRRALVGRGNFMLADTHRRFAVPVAIWVKMTTEQKAKRFRRFRKHVANDYQLQTATDKQTMTAAPRTSDGKTCQTKRKLDEPTTTTPKRTKTC